MKYTLTIDIADLGGETHNGDSVILYAPAVRGGTAIEQVTSTARKQVYLDKGKAKVQIEPGPVVVELHCRGIVDNYPKETVMPKRNTTLRELLEKTFDYEPPVLASINEEAAAAVGKIAEVKLQVESLKEIQKQVESSAQQASQSQLAAEKNNTSAKQHADTASEAKNAASKSAADVTRIQQEVKQSAQTVAQNLEAVKRSAQQASASEKSAQAAAEHANQAKATAEEAISKFDRVDESVKAAESARDVASGHASAASKAVQEFKSLPDTVSWDGDKLTVGGKQSGSLRGPQGEPGKDGQVTFEALSPEQKAQLKGDKGEPGKPGERGKPGAPGKDGRSPVVSMQGDRLTVDGKPVGESLRGPQGEPGRDGARGPAGPPGPAGKDGSLAEIKGISDVPGLDRALGEKADKSHSHELRDFVGLVEALMDKAPKSELRELQSQVNSAPKIQVVSNLPYSPDRSTIYVVTG